MAFYLAFKSYKKHDFIFALPVCIARLWTIYSATTFLEKYKKWFCKLDFFLSGQPLFSNLKKAKSMV